MSKFSTYTPNPALPGNHQSIGERGLRLLLPLLISIWMITPAHARRLLPNLTSKGHYQEVERPRDIGSDKELEAKGVRIGKITIDAANIFDTQQPEENSSLFRLANRLHIKTREATIRQQLLFKPGEIYSGRELAESERILRRQNYLFDASIRPVRLHNGIVDIEVSSRDVWTLKPGLSFSRSGGKNSGSIEIEETNLLGTGSQIRLTNNIGVDRNELSLFYRDTHFRNTWWDFSVGYSNNNDGDSTTFELDHPFYSFDTRQAGGVSWKTFRRIESRYDLGKIVDQYSENETSAKLYYGWSDGYQAGWTTRYRSGMTLEQKRFETVSGSHPTLRLPPDITLIYPWLQIELLQDQFLKDHNRDQINRTEDIDLGWHISAQLGYATESLGADRDALVFDGSLRKGVAIGRSQTLQWNSTLSGRQEQGGWSNLLLGAKFQYYLHESPRRTLYLALGGDASNKLDADQQLLLGGDNGLRGYPLRYQAGEGRWLFTLEQRFFTSWYPFRLFNVGAAIFTDIGRTWGDNPDGTRSKGLLRDIGFGFRLGNARSGLGNVLHLDFAFPLDGNGQVDSFQFLVQTKNSF